MSTELTKKTPIENGDRGLVLRSFDELWRFANAVHASQMVAKTFTSVEQIVIALQVGSEVGLPPMQALQSIAVIQGRATIWGDALPGLVWASGLCEGIEESIEGTGDNRRAICSVKRRGVEKPIVRSFSVADAKTAKLWGKTTRTGEPTPWVNHPERMMAMRARSYALRDGFADVLRGLQCREEVLDYAGEVAEQPQKRKPARLPEVLPDETVDAVIETQSTLGELAERLRKRIEDANGMQLAQLALEIGEFLADGGLTQQEADELTAVIRGRQ